jgi:hypothetical protein
MTPLDLNRIYVLLPAVYRIRDAQAALNSGATLDPADLQQLQGLLENLANLTPVEQQQLAELQDKQQRGPLKSLVAIFAEQIEVLQESLYQSYDDLFIETCQEWLVPYIGALVGVAGLANFPGTPYSLRAAVANTIRNRRRKGTVYGLEQLSHDVTGWQANVVEYFQLLATTQFMNHIRPGNLSMADVRRADWGLPGTPFDAAAHALDVRSIASGRGKFNISNIGIHLWRLQPLRLENSPAFRVDARRYKFDALGRDTQLFTLVEATDQDLGRRVTPLDVPMPIDRKTLYANFARYYGQNLSLWLENVTAGSLPAALPVRVCNLANVTDGSGHVTGWAHAPLDAVAIDPELGRIAFPSAVPPPKDVHVRYCYGFSAPMGGGSYSRPFDDTGVLIHVPQEHPTIQAALHHAETQIASGAKAVTIEVDNNQYYVETPVVRIAANASVTLRAADGMRPVLVLSGDFNMFGGTGSAFTLNGLMVSGGCIAAPLLDKAAPNALATLTISHCTLAPMAAPAIGGAPAQMMGPRICLDAEDLAVVINHTITGPLRVSGGSNVTVSDSIIDAGAPTEVAYANEDCTGPGAPLTITSCTVIGTLQAREIPLGSNSIFLAEADPGTPPVLVQRLQQGCVRFCYVPPGSSVPRAYRCYPAAGDPAPLVPVFTSLLFGDPGYCQLSSRSAPATLQGADDQSQMGAFHGLYQPRRLANLRVNLADYLRFGLEAGIFFAT